MKLEIYCIKHAVSKREYKRSNGYRQFVCKYCAAEQKILSKPKSERQRYKRLYDTTPEEIALLEARQDGRCAICYKHSRKKLHIDHSHISGKIRGLLCSNCNVGIGLLGDNYESLALAANYLKGK